ncbi:free fatty acid receptor 4-like [Neodiprion pinetum]|uniref:Free fatty acid receptor 4-like n=1 Tax=Neodiprion lecontei TaxID=441921 RepID=A0ABM3FMS9_NEOLC|nr:free fatty acid receptor 4-like [Neodiprion fabricii]XP_046417976.1 free fatty acid receptor 4-like [Neodiprion fabricii]XP_046472909.1 free fatty acid receptor 4-like [Neodiprion pinetum]XP_046472910.1 free fatty acid receptor 4-like [Neodiprion pinetum]XP_046589325.1 free fatty acid receptor 4-like [Neodiprion lecontei]XP_046611210.1 free fatty acid receptor 4-like [Neodiprion virginianus]XP_046611211.1 free fatty acid receptor 4-like [Neodiprion virginianus]
MNSSYLWGDDEEWGPRYFFTYYSQFGERNGASGVEVVILAVTFVIAVIANLGIAACVLRYKEMRTPTNLCLVNLAAADLLFALGVPAVAYTRLTQKWRLGDSVCRLLPYSQFVCGFVLLWTLTLISMDRHRCLAVAPYRSALTGPRVVAASLITWVIGASLFLPAAFWFKPKEVNGDVICTLIFPRNESINVSLCFTIPIIILACLLPMGLLVYHYQRIFQRILDTRNRWAVSCVAQGVVEGGTVRRDSELSVVSTLVPWAGRKLSTASMSGRQGRAGSLSHHEEIRLHKHLRVVRILLLNVVAVLVMWLPITIVMFLIYIDGRRPNEDTNFFLKSHHFLWALVIAQLNTVVNPLLYGVFSENFRSCFAKFWGRGRNNDRTGSGERGSGGTGTRKGGRSLEALQDRLGPRTPSSLRTGGRPPKKSSSCSIGSIIEVPSSEKL